MDISAIPIHEYNTTLINELAPPTWKNPKADGVYNLIVIGGGSAGLTAAKGAAGVGAKVALIEKGLLGGDCLNVGCVPSKAILRSAKAVGDIRKADKFGISIPDGVEVDFKSVMERVWGARAKIAPHDSAETLTNAGVDVFFGAAEFVGKNEIAIDGQTLRFKKAVIATGSRPFVIPFDGLEEAGYITNETIWNLTEQPRSMAVIGAGVIGVEMAQAFQRLGTQISLFDISPNILPREDEEAAEIVYQSLAEDGVDFCLGAKTEKIMTRNGKKVIRFEHDGQMKEKEVDEILMAVGRQANMEGLGLETAGVETHKKGIVVDDTLVTTNPDIYAAGDVSLKHQFTHTAGHSAGLVVRNALFPGPKGKYSNFVVPWATYSDPEIAHVGLYPEEARGQGIDVDTFRSELAENDRGITDSVTSGFVKIHVKKGTDQIVGATIVSKNAGDMISEITMAMVNKIGLKNFTSVIHPYPTSAESIHKAAMAYNKTRLTPRVHSIMKWWMKRARGS